MSFFDDAGAWFEQAGKDTGEWIDQAVQDTGDALTGNSKAPESDPISDLSETDVPVDDTYYDPITNSNPAINPATGGWIDFSDNGLKITDLEVGTGVEASYRQTLEVHYRGTLENGTVFDSSYGRGTYNFPLVESKAIEGWVLGLQGMKVGGKRTLEIPPELGFGARGSGSVIPPNATLIFEVELIAVDGNRDTASPTYETHDAQSLSNNPDPITLDPVLPDQVTEADDPQISSGPVLPDLVSEYHDPLTGLEPIQLEGVLEPFDSLTNPNQVFAGTVSETIELTALDLQGGVEETFIERDPFAISGIEGTVIEPIDGLQGLLTDGPAEFSEEQLQADLVNSMAASTEVLA